MANRHLFPTTYPEVPLAPLTCSTSDHDVTRSLVVDVIDDRSSSTYDTDPRRRRERELHSVIRWLAAAECHPEDAVSVQHFDDVIDELGPTEVGTSTGDAEEVIEHLPVGAPESSSNLAPQVRRATGWATGTDTTRVLVIATDGMLMDFEEAFDALEAYPGAVHVLVLGTGLPAEWDALARPFSTTSLTERVRFGDVAIAVSDAIRRTDDDRIVTPTKETP